MSLQFLFRNIKVGKKEMSLVTVIWFGFALIAALAQVFRHSYRNYLIYKGVFWHLLAQKNLFVEYPLEYLDTNHYGPSFSLLIAPFAVLPDSLAVILWALFNAWVLFRAIRLLPLERQQQYSILAIAAIEMMTATHNVQFNTMLAGWIILSFALVEKEKDFWATFFIAAGFLVKLYGIGALLFFVFSKHKVRFAGSFLFWCVLLFALPMLIASPHFVVHSYADWYASLIEKNSKNADLAASGGWQDISVPGMIRRISGHPLFNSIYVLAPAAILVLAPLLRWSQYRFYAFRLSYLALVLISVVIFSSSAESSTYVIPVCGVGIWYVLHRNEKKGINLVLGLALLFTSLSATDFFPRRIARFIRHHALKALPCFVIWLWLITEVCFKDFSAQKNKIQAA